MRQRAGKGVVEQVDGVGVNGVGVEVRCDDVHSVPRELQRDGMPDTVAGAGDDRDAILQIFQGHSGVPPARVRAY